MVGNWLNLPQVAEGEGSLLGWTHTHTETHQEKQKRLIKYFPFFHTFKLSQFEKDRHCTSELTHKYY